MLYCNGNSWGVAFCFVSIFFLFLQTIYSPRGRLISLLYIFYTLIARAVLRILKVVLMHERKFGYHRGFGQWGWEDAVILFKDKPLFTLYSYRSWLSPFRDFYALYYDIEIYNQETNIYVPQPSMVWRECRGTPVVPMILPGPGKTSIPFQTLGEWRPFLFLQSFLIHSKEKICNSISTWDFTSWIRCYALKWNENVEKNHLQSVSFLTALGLVRAARTWLQGPLRQSPRLGDHFPQYIC